MPTYRVSFVDKSRSSKRNDALAKELLKFVDGKLNFDFEFVFQASKESAKDILDIAKKYKVGCYIIP